VAPESAFNSFMPKPPQPTNFNYLDPDAPRTKRIIEAALTVYVPWHPQDPARRWEPPALAELARRIAERARQGKVVRLSPTTAGDVAIALHLQAQGPQGLRDTHPHTVEDRTREPREVLSYNTSATLAIGAWNAYAPQHPDRRIVAYWGGWVMRDSKRDRA
jgi:hypothetical protein